VVVRAGPKLCTTDYEGVTLGDELESESDIWEEDAIYHILVTFDLSRDHFNNPVQSLKSDKIARPHRKPFGPFYPLETFFHR